MRYWLLGRSAPTILMIATLFVVGLFFFYFGNINIPNPAQLSLLQRLPWALFGVLASISFFGLWYSMWVFRRDIDDSSMTTKRLWLVVLILGLAWGSCLYFYAVYLPRRKKNLAVHHF